MRNVGGKLLLMIMWNQIALADYSTLSPNNRFHVVSSLL